MLRSSLWASCILCAAVFFGCSKTETTNNRNKMAENSNKATTATTTTTATTKETTGEKIGIPECDDFIAKYDACVSSKVPEMMRAQYKSTLAEWRRSWKKLAADPASKPTVVAACKQMAAQQATVLKAYGCAF